MRARSVEFRPASCIRLRRMPKYKKLKSFTVDRAKWARGGRGGNPGLLNDAGNMCCLGHISKQCGAKLNTFYGMPEDLAIDVHSKPYALLKDFLISIDVTARRDFYNNDLAGKAAIINDSRKTSDKQREAKLTKLFAKAGYKLKFVGKYVDGEYTAAQARKLHLLNG